MLDQWQAKLAADERWTEQDARRALASWAGSGESARAFARRHGMNPQRLAWWRDRLAASEATRFVPVVVSEVSTEASPPTGSAAVTLRIGELCIAVDDVSKVPASWVAELASGLRGWA